MKYIYSINLESIMVIVYLLPKTQIKFIKLEKFGIFIPNILSLLILFLLTLQDIL